MCCKYCDMNDKKYNFKESNDKIRQSLINNDFFNNLIKNFSFMKEKNIEISLWGLEPSINFDICQDFIKNCLDYFINTNKISYSTNCGLGFNQQKYLIDCLELYSRPIELDIQFSIDGPNWITNNTRQVGANEKVISVIKQILEYSKQLKNIKISGHLKPTLDSHYMKILADDDEKFYEFYNFFYDLKKEFNKIQGTFDIDYGIPTLVIPHYHTVEDGIIFTKFLNKINKYKKEFNQPLFAQTLVAVKEALNNDFSFYMCSAGSFTLAIDCDGEIYGCHNLFKLSYDDSLDDAIRAQSSKYNNKEKLMWQQKLLYQYKETYESFMDGLIIALVKSKQIQDIYTKDIRARNILKKISMSMLCPYGHITTTKNVWILTTSYLKLFGNGAVQELIKLSQDK